jgi:mono/diheme cytochrome c family protein
VLIAAVRATPIVVAIVFGCALGTAWADESPGMTHASTGAGQTGAEIYAHICQGCHMPQGQGAAGAGHYPSLAHSDDLAGRLGQVVAATVVLNGRNGMPAFGHSQRSNPSNETSEQAAASQLLSDAQIAEIVNYIRSHFGNRYQERLTAAAVAALRHPTSTPAY